MTSHSGIIILLTDAREMKRRQQEELIFYRSEMERLQAKMELLAREIRLTEHIIKIIERETTANTVNIQ